MSIPLVPPSAQGIDLAAAKRLSAALHAAGLLERATNIGELESIFAAEFAKHRIAIESLRPQQPAQVNGKGKK